MLTVEIVSDIVCPWCFIGLRRLETAVARMRADDPGFACRRRWRPFFLNPDTPPGGEPYLPFLERKFGGRARVEAVFEHVRAAGRAYGLEYAFEKIALRANTLHAHRLIHWAQQRGDAAALVERLFVAQFQRGEHVGDPAVLTAVAVECGYPGDAVAAYLASAQDAELVRAQERELRMRGIDMVPTFILGGTRIVVGAEDPAVLVAAMRQALAAGAGA
ncbi:MAG: DsbA family oxidoreductase [Rhodocyclales bacterium]|nr:DsbA family oxidoreductase [Rhodocyclales bacterium]